jgi:hypothetical protein
MQKFVSRIFRSEMQRPSGAYAWQMPFPSVEPRPPPSEWRLDVPDDAQEASYFAASARMLSLSMIVRFAMLSPIGANIPRTSAAAKAFSDGAMPQVQALAAKVDTGFASESAG